MDKYTSKQAIPDPNPDHDPQDEPIFDARHQAIFILQVWGIAWTIWSQRVLRTLKADLDKLDASGGPDKYKKVLKLFQSRGETLEREATKFREDLKKALDTGTVIEETAPPPPPFKKPRPKHKEA
jgi:hypothetical protein